MFRRVYFFVKELYKDAEVAPVSDFKNGYLICCRDILEFMEDLIWEEGGEG